MIRNHRHQDHSSCAAIYSVSSCCRAVVWWCVFWPLPTQYSPTASATWSQPPLYSFDCFPRCTCRRHYRCLAGRQYFANRAFLAISEHPAYQRRSAWSQVSQTQTRCCFASCCFLLALATYLSQLLNLLFANKTTIQQLLLLLQTISLLIFLVLMICGDEFICLERRVGG